MVTHTCPGPEEEEEEFIRIQPQLVTICEALIFEKAPS